MKTNTTFRISELAGVFLWMTLAWCGPMLVMGQTTPNWPQFRGERSLGVASADLPVSWTDTTNMAWKTEIPGKGWSSPVVWGDKLFVTSAGSDHAIEPSRKGLYAWRFWGSRGEGEYRWMVYCLDLNSGKILWEQEAHHGPVPGAIHLKNSYASETPVTDGEHLIVYFGNAGLFCYDMTGHQLWAQKWEYFPTRLGWGPAASPLLYKDRVYVVNDNEKSSFLVALDKRTGRELWRVKRDEPSNWSTPVIWENELRTEIVTAGRGKVRSYDLDGKLLWELSGMSSITIPTPVSSRSLLYVSSGYVSESMRPVYAIKPGASGDISLKGEETSNAFIVWSNRKAGPYNPSPLLYQDRLYVLYDKGEISCFNAATGQLVYERQKLVGGQHFTASPWVCNGRIYCLNEDGVTFVLGAGDKFELQQTNPLGADEMSLATPAMAGDRLLIRTAARLYCIRTGR